MNYSIVLKIKNYGKYELYTTPVFGWINSIYNTYEIKDFEEKEKIKITEVYQFEEDNERCYLYQKCLYFICNTLNPLTFEIIEEDINNISIDKKTKKKKGNAEDILFDNKLEMNSIFSFFNFIDTLLKIENNEKITKYIKKLMKDVCTIYNLTDSNAKILYKNFLVLCFNNIKELEKFINSNNEKFITKNILTSDFKLTSAKKLSHTVGLPSFALKLIKENHMESCMVLLTEISKVINGNDLRVLLENFKNCKKLLTLNKLNTDAKGKDIKNKKFLEDFLYLVNGQAGVIYKTTDLLNYLLRQSLYFGINKSFSFPYAEMSLLKDYLHICKEYKLTPEKYPQDIKKIHDIILLNISSLNNIKEIDFENAIKLYKKYEMILDKDGFIFKTPKEIKDLIEEGNELHHCIGSYANKIVKKECIIFFMRNKNEPEKPFITIEIDNNCNIVEIKGIYNEEPHINYIHIANKWAGICKKIK